MNLYVECVPFMGEEGLWQSLLRLTRLGFIIDPIAKVLNFCQEVIKCDWKESFSDHNQRNFNCVPHYTNLSALRINPLKKNYKVNHLIELQFNCNTPSPIRWSKAAPKKSNLDILWLEKWFVTYYFYNNINW